MTGEARDRPRRAYPLSPQCLSSLGVPTVCLRLSAAVPNHVAPLLPVLMPDSKTLCCLTDVPTADRPAASRQARPTWDRTRCLTGGTARVESVSRICCCLRAGRMDAAAAPSYAASVHGSVAGRSPVGRRSASYAELAGDNFLYDFQGRASGTPAPGLRPGSTAEGRELAENESVN